MTPKQLLSSIALVCLLLWTQAAYAQNKTISGKVTDSKDGAAISGATVQPKGTRKGVTTGADGTFKISVDANVSKLVISSVGFANQEVDISGKTEITVSLVVTNTSLNEVVVVGYGTRKVKDATGSVASITTKDFNKGVISTPEQLLQGRTPGVIVSPSSGEPGASATINIRGTASIRGNQEPLYIVDGVPVTSSDGNLGTASGVEGSSTPKNPLAFLNPNDIESISILKDASSAAIYGSRGANGVIIITTKSGKGRQSSFSFSATTSVSKIASRYDLLSPQDFLVAVKKANIAAGTSPEDAAVAVANVDKGYSTDWQDQIFRTGVNQNYNLSWGFNKKATALRLSGSYDDQQGIVKNSGLKRLTGRANLTQKFLDEKLKFDVNLTYSNVKSTYPPLTNNAGYQGSLVGAVIAFNPTFPIYNPNGTFYDPGDGNRNPVEMLAYFDDKDKTNRFLTSVSGSYTIIKGLTYKATFGYDESKTERLSFADPRLGSNAFGGTNNVFGKDLKNGIQGNGRVVKQKLDLKTILVEHTLTYDKTFSNGHVLNAVAGFSYQKTTTDYTGRVGWGLATPVVAATDVFVKDFNNFKNYYDFVPGNSEYELQSYFGRVNYTIADKYLLTGTLRADGSSKFGKNNKYGYFPAFGAKWRLLKEGFAKGLTKIFNDLSIRANYGIIGSQEGISPYDAVDFATTYIGNSGQKETVLNHQGNEDLKWETATTTGAAVEFALLNNRVNGSVEYYYTERKDVIFYGPTPGGFAPSSNWFTNLPGIVVNKGLEVGLSAKIIDGKKFKWEANYNMTFLKNRVKDLPVSVNTGAVSGQGLSGAYAQTIANGYPLFTFKMPTFQGFDGNGNARYANGGKDELQGSALPKFLAGLANNFTWGQWSASVFVNTVRGFYIYNNTANALLLAGSIKTAHNVTYAVANSPESPINPGSVSSRFLEKGDFIRLSNASISYAFNLKTKKIKSLSISLSGQNLALFTKYSGLDPEVNVDKQINGYPSRGFDYTGYPRPRTFTLGVNVGF